MESKASVIKMIRSVPNKVQLAKKIVSLILLFNDAKLSETEVIILAYFIVYGITPATKNLIVSSKVTGSLGNIKMAMVKFKKMGLIYKDDLNNKVYISKNLQIELTPTVAMYLKLDIN